MKDLLACIASRGKPVADIEQGYMSTAACILANVSMQVGRSLTWDHAEGTRRRRRRGQPAAARARTARRGCIPKADEV